MNTKVNWIVCSMYVQQLESNNSTQGSCCISSSSAVSPARP